MANFSPYEVMEQHATTQRPAIALMVKPVGESLKRLMHDSALDQLIIGRRAPSGWTGERLNINDKHMSRQHCRIFWDAEKQHWKVEDMQSANGTVIGGSPMREPVPLADGMLLQMGMSMVRVELMDKPPSEEELARQRAAFSADAVTDTQPSPNLLDTTIIKSVDGLASNEISADQLDSVEIADDSPTPDEPVTGEQGAIELAEIELDDADENTSEIYDEQDVIETIVTSDEPSPSAYSDDSSGDDLLDFSLPTEEPIETSPFADSALEDVIGGHEDEEEQERAIAALLGEAESEDSTQIRAGDDELGLDELGLLSGDENDNSEPEHTDADTLTRIEGMQESPARADYGAPEPDNEFDTALTEPDEDATTIGAITSIPDLADITDIGGDMDDDSTALGSDTMNAYQAGPPANQANASDEISFDPFDPESSSASTLLDDRASLPEGYDRLSSGAPLSSSGKRIVLKGMARTLADRNLLDEASAADIQEEAQNSGISFFRALADTQAAKFMDDIYAWVAEEQGFELIHDEADVFEKAVETPWLNYEQSRELGILALGSDDPRLARYACVDPFNIMTRDWVQRRSGLTPIPVLAPSPAVIGAIERVKNSATEMDEVGLVIDLNPEDERQIDTYMGDVDIPQMVNYFLHRASLAGASDVHVEPTEDRLLVRFRVNGILYEERSLPMAHSLAIASRLKIMSGMNVAEKRRPQDGRIGVVIRGKPIDVRVSTFPTVHGEKIVMRLLDKSALRPSPELLGLLDRDLRLLKDKIQAPYGLIMISGPTGSGKTTTLYSCLGSIDKTEKNVLTVEDPVEYQMQGVHQMQVNAKIGLTFASGLRTILRQDPDVIMVGECRDAETAEMAIQAALTGHIVFSTIHTNDAIGVISRLIDMGIEPFLVSTALSMTIAQRLVREICPHCKTTVMGEEIIENLAKDGISAERLEQLGIDIDEDIDYAEGKGCKHCRFTGYAGRRAVFEVFELNEEVRSHIVSEHFADAALRRLAHDSGMTTLIRHGLKLVDDEITTFSEVMRVLGEAN